VRLLIAEDDSASRRLLEGTLIRWGYEVVVTRDGGEALAALSASDAPRLAILDWMMPGLDGVDVCRSVRRAGDSPYQYLILLTTQAGEDDLVFGLDAGADDYIRKPFNPSELKARLRAGRRILALQDELIAERDLFQSKAARDPLTRLWNHEEILRVLAQELSRAGREPRSVGVIIADLDRFKHVNDTYGHMAGDAVIRAAARTMSSLVRPYDALGRFGGDEFLVVLPGCDTWNARALAERLRQGVSKEPIDTPEGLIPVAMSLGVAVCDGSGAANTDAIVKVADAALYRAKELGSNRVEIAAPLLR
jgi:diguanylate cyclase (GGDEF)-like protein